LTEASISLSSKRGAPVAEHTVLEAEITGLIALSGLMLVFLPFFLDRLRRDREGSSSTWMGISRALTWLTAFLVVLPCLTAALGLLALWGVADSAGLVGVLSLLALGSVAVYTVGIVALENTIWWARTN
jgi:hypothetical protein